MIEPTKFFSDKFNIAIEDLEKLLRISLSKGGDYADLYLEYTVQNSLNLEEQIIKSANRSVRQGVGVRVISGERTGYAYCDEIAFEAVGKATLTAAHIAQSGVEAGPINVSAASPAHDLYPVAHPLSDEPLERKIELLTRIDRTSRAYDRRVREVQTSFADEYKVVLIATSEGLLIGDVQPLARMRVMCIADDDGNLQSGVSGGGGRIGLDYFNDGLIEHYANEAARQ
ncbi:MAG: metalloprotease TldD, partial [Blastocatellia bacterium]|nr:metalloprotease TldD [Blastocatellia bacterium]